MPPYQQHCVDDVRCTSRHLRMLIYRQLISLDVTGSNVLCYCKICECIKSPVNKIPNGCYRWRSCDVSGSESKHAIDIGLLCVPQVYQSECPYLDRFEFWEPSLHSDITASTIFRHKYIWSDHLGGIIGNSYSNRVASIA